jgi:hypothetical protein
MKINGWQRIGIILSVIWIIGAGMYTLNWLSDKDIETAGFFYSQCASTRDEVSQAHRVECEKKSEKAFIIDMTPRFLVSAWLLMTKNFGKRMLNARKRARITPSNATPGERLGAAIVAFGPVPLA